MIKIDLGEIEKHTSRNFSRMIADWSIYGRFGDGSTSYSDITTGIMAHYQGMAQTPKPYLYPNGDPCPQRPLPDDMFMFYDPLYVPSYWEWDDFNDVWVRITESKWSAHVTSIGSNTANAGAGGTVGNGAAIYNSINFNGLSFDPPTPLEILDVGMPKESKSSRVDTKCECGSESAGSSKHSGYCPKYSKA